MIRNILNHCLKFPLHCISCHICYGKISEKYCSTVIKDKLLVSKVSNSCFKGIMLELPTIKTDFLFENSQDFNQTTHARPQHPIVFIHLYFNCISSVKYVFKRLHHSHVMPFSAVRPKPWNFQYGFQHTLKYLTWSSTQFSTWFIP